MSLLEEFVAEINRGIYYREFSFTKNNFTTLPGLQELFVEAFQSIFRSFTLYDLSA